MKCSFCGGRGESYGLSTVCKLCYKMKRYYDGTLKCSTDLRDKAETYILEVNPSYLKVNDAYIQKLTTNEFDALASYALRKIPIKEANEFLGGL